METAHLGITEDHKQNVALALNTLLADEYVLLTKTRNYHWNVAGPQFIALHTLYETQYQTLAAGVDEVAERIRALGHYAEARLADFLKLTNLLEPTYTNDAPTQLRQLIDDHETVIKELRTLADRFADEWKDAGTSDLVTGLLRQHEKMAWMLRASLS
ncbi:starvation-inducible DNA-binding protein [Catalinimonas alkaloidigena]|uniref:Starvation-inducible DNA-binding protein n=1 Tax=Catalinimonas alkaloidigena TaxID=1075417 RepID=A0A1G9TGC3_9BACT|nr:DNA starvation/stationary phase protection protein [Catalinimonas alkaloidigena]SDM46766.1 starvation-inducible DNA-binding protein [Catalinimonas alkaloidigena]